MLVVRRRLDQVEANAVLASVRRTFESGLKEAVKALRHHRPSWTPTMRERQNRATPPGLRRVTVFALLRLAQDIIGCLHLLEALGGVEVARPQIGVVLFH